ncbi:MAG: PAS domain-containing protein, partial [Candidatus Bathyarchaeia archaeon]
EGLPREEAHRLCDIHLALSRESLQRGSALPPAGHPVHILMEEHRILQGLGNRLRDVAKQIRGGESVEAEGEKELRHILEHIRGSESHYLREENVLFPYLEKHGVTQPPAIMWMEHDKIREIKRSLYALLDASSPTSLDAEKLERIAFSLADTLTSHFYKENSILFPTALQVMSESEWQEVRRQFDELGYCSFTPEAARVPFKKEEAPVSEGALNGLVAFETGELTKDQLEAILNTLPVEITFVDKDDTVRYFNQTEERLFVRTKAVLGRKVQQCHPQKSLHLVNQILDDFKNRRREHADFWISFKGRFVYIRYFPVWGRNGDYLGCLEVSQDITDIKQLQGEKRLLTDNSN